MTNRDIETVTDFRDVIKLARKSAKKYGDGDNFQAHYIIGWLAQEIASRNKENNRG